MIGFRKVVIAILGGVIGVSLVSWQPWKSKVANAVPTGVVKTGSVTATVSAVGVLEPSQIVQVGAQVSQLKAVHVALGGEVRAGDLIAEIDSLKQENELKLAEASLAEAEASKRSREIRLLKANRIFARQQGLYEKNAGSGADLMEAEADAKTARAEFDLASATVQKTRLAVRKARTDLGYTRIVAPIDGRVIALVAKPGQTLNAAQITPVIAVIANTDLMRIKAQVSEADMGQIQVGQKVRFTTFGDRKTVRESVLREVEPAPTSILTSGQPEQQRSSTTSQAVYYNALFDAPNEDGRLLSQMTAQVTFIVAKAENVLLVPFQALQATDKDDTFAVAVRMPDGSTKSRKVTIGVTDRINAEVLSGLVEGDQIMLHMSGAAEVTQ
ncbi:efflux RND transporter periplasmic adaptor subunit [Bradyrhizobium sp. LMG 9283]|uniref:efflux RND transporter periplasmic adaptor subunit n=1 Tax=Bradyrhizobium sp. LMG 9283 TaxID=592064 RepID=UPI00388FA819